MKKFFGRLAATEPERDTFTHSIANTSAQPLNPLIGKQFNIRRYSLVVEDVIAEGKSCVSLYSR